MVFGSKSCIGRVFIFGLSFFVVKSAVQWCVGKWDEREQRIKRQKTEKEMAYKANYREMTRFSEPMRRSDAEKISALVDAYRQEAERRGKAIHEKIAKLEIEQKVASYNSIQRKKEQQKIDDQKDALRTFALKESPQVWRTIQQLTSEITEMGRKERELSAALSRFNEDPEKDPDILRLRDVREQLKRQVYEVWDKLKEAYLASKRYEAMPNRKDFNELMRRSLNEGVEAAELAERRYTELKKKNDSR